MTLLLSHPASQEVISDQLDAFEQPPLDLGKLESAWWLNVAVSCRCRTVVCTEYLSVVRVPASGKYLIQLNANR